jgi:hypothetical protein
VKNILNNILIAILFVVIKVINSVQYIKMGYYKIRGIPYYMYTDHKFGIKDRLRVYYNEKN